MSNKVVYLHRYKRTMKIFYVGYGSIRRSKEKGKNRRSKSYNNFLGRKKKSSIIVEIVANNLDKETAMELESLLIEDLGRIKNNSGILVNTYI